MASKFSKRMWAFVDTETTGGSAQGHRIIEIGIVKVCDGEIVDSWSTLVNPERPISPFIQDFTGITEEDVQCAPTFATIAKEVQSRLEGAVFVAHNARFDYAFVKSELRRAGIRYQARTLCTVQLSRLLYPGFKSHSLDSVMERHGLMSEHRHRALDDAKTMVDFWSIAQNEKKDVFEWTVEKLLERPALPPTLRERALEELPETPGVYIFYGKGRRPIYIGKSVNLRQRVFQHFASDHALHKDYKIAKDIVDIEIIETAGELGALLLESRLVKEQLPIFNRALRKITSHCTAMLSTDNDGYHTIRFERTKHLTYKNLIHAYGIFYSERTAIRSLRDIAREHQLCPVRLGLEKAKKKEPCLSYHLKFCSGACVGEVSEQTFNSLVLKALERHRHQEWPFDSAIGIKESNPESGLEEVHVFDRWMYVGTCKSEDELQDLLSRSLEYSFTMDTYRIIRTYLRKYEGKKIIKLQRSIAQ